MQYGYEQPCSMAGLCFEQFKRVVSPEKPAESSGLSASHKNVAVSHFVLMLSLAETRREARNRQAHKTLEDRNHQSETVELFEQLVSSLF